MQMRVTDFQSRQSHEESDWMGVTKLMGVRARQGHATEGATAAAAATTSTWGLGVVHAFNLGGRFDLCPPRLEKL